MGNKSLAQVLVVGMVRWFLAALTTGFVTSLLLGTLVWVLTARAHAIEMDTGTARRDTVTRGTLLLVSRERSARAPAVLYSTSSLRSIYGSIGIRCVTD